MVWNKFKNLDYKVKLYIFYGFSVLGISYFIYDINTITYLLSSNQLFVEEVGFNLLNNQISSFTYDHNSTIGGTIRKIALDLIQIIFLVMFMLILYIHEVNNDKTN